MCCANELGIHLSAVDSLCDEQSRTARSPDNNVAALNQDTLYRSVLSRTFRSIIIIHDHRQQYRCASSCVMRRTRGGRWFLRAGPAADFLFAYARMCVSASVLACSRSRQMRALQLCTYAWVRAPRYSAALPPLCAAACRRAGQRRATPNAATVQWHMYTVARNDVRGRGILQIPLFV